MSDDVSASPPPADDVGATLEKILRLAVALALLVWCFVILAPFAHGVLWGVLLAVTVYPAFRRLVAAMRGRATAAATVFALAGLAAILVPTVLFSATLVGGAQDLAAELKAGTLDVPPPPPRVASWPVIGGPLHDFWMQASTDIGPALAPIAPHLQGVGKAILGLAGSLGGAVLQFVFAILIAAAFLAKSAWAERFTGALAARLAGRRGTDFARIAVVTIRGVARGVLGVAIIQSTLAGIGFAVVGIPGAGLWALICLVFTTVQIPAALVVVPSVIYVWSVESTTTAAIYTVWAVVVMTIDNVLKPFLFGKDVETPALVLLIGSIGGMLTSGVVGLFTGAVILALGYELLRAWLYGATHDGPAPIPGETGDTSPAA
jgi:predicted PurR-regulated permease PerM